MNRTERRRAATKNRERIAGLNESGLQEMMPGGDPRQAQSLFRQVLSIDPNNAQANLRLGVMEMWAQNYEQAEKYFLISLKSEPKDPLTLNNLGLCRHQQGAIEDALALYEQALALDPDNAEARINFARALLHVRAFDQALEEAKLAVVKAPALASAHFILGSIAQVLGHTGLAKTSLQKTIDLQPDHLEANFRICRVSYDPAHPGDWIAASQAAYEANSETIDCALTWSDILGSAGRHSEITGLLEGLVEQADIGQKIGLFNNLANAAAELEDFDTAIAWHKKAIAVDVDDAGTRFFYGRTLFRAGQSGPASQQLQRCQKGMPFAQDLIGMLMHGFRSEDDEEAAAAKEDFDTWLKVQTLEPSAPWSTPENFNKALTVSLRGIDPTPVHPFDKSRRLGATAREDIFEKSAGEPLAFLRSAVQGAMQDYVQSMPEYTGQNHPLTVRKKAGMGPSRAYIETAHTFEDFSYSIDQQGWFRLIYFIDVPEACDNDKTKAGWLRFGVPHYPGLDAATPDHVIKPVAGQFILFPAYYWFGFNALSADSDLVFLSATANSAAG